jgi:septal ring factor EnvC (AmiA/AmiB activator)
MSNIYCSPVCIYQVKKDATELVGAVAHVIAEFTVAQCMHNVTAAVNRSNDSPVVVQSTVPTSESSDADLKKIVELEQQMSKKNDHIHALVVSSEASEAEMRLLKVQVQNGEEKLAKSASDINTLKDKINELTKENYYSKEEIAKLSEEVEVQKAQMAEQLSAAVGATITTSAADEERLRVVNAELDDARMKLGTLEAEAHNSNLSAKVAAGELAERNALIEKMSSEYKTTLDDKESSLQEKEVTITQLRKLVSDLKGTKDELESQLNELKEDPTLTAKIEKLQAVARGFNARARVKRTKMHRDAQTSGVLVATKHTTQGDSGWYCAPDGSLYYFVLDADEWILTCGPITREAFEETVLNLKPKTVNSGGYLKVSNFDLVTQTVDQPGELYMSTSTWKLYFAVSVDHLVTENR